MSCARLLLLTALIASAAARRRRPELRVPAAARGAPARPGVANCTERWYAGVDADHFRSGAAGAGINATFAVRVFEHDAAWGGPGAPIWFYAGNEADVEQYVNATGLMWENAREHRALLVFAEHRFYGRTAPCDPAAGGSACLALLTHEQAMADYVHVVGALRRARDPNASSPVLAFGGSYGGMLAAWLRFKYPATFAGALAASAPILGFPGDAFYEGAGGSEAAGGEGYWAVVTADAGAAGGASAACSANVARALAACRGLSATADGRAELSAAFGLCPDAAALSDDDADGYRVGLHALFAFDELAMGNYPFASTYISGASALPPFPMRVACAASLADAALPDDALVGALAAAVNVLYNASGAEPCVPLPPRDDELDGIWDYQWCTELLPQETYFARAGPPADMFDAYAYNASFARARCLDKYAVAPRPTWIEESYGGAAGVARAASRVVFSNGDYDPWSAAGVRFNVSERDVVSVQIAEGAHHLDLMFATADDPPGLAAARALELGYLAKWADAYARE